MIHGFFRVIVIERPISLLVTELLYFQFFLGKYRPLIETTRWWLMNP